MNEIEKMNEIEEPMNGVARKPEDIDINLPWPYSHWECCPSCYTLEIDFLNNDERVCLLCGNHWVIY